MSEVSTSVLSYCNSLTEYSRMNTHEVKIGKVSLGGSNPIRIQSMTTTDTMDTMATVEQAIRMYKVGCEYVRITAPSIKEARNLAVIKEEIERRGFDIPLIADIHFTPNAAEEAAKIVEKVRINPGNYADKKKFQNIEYSDATYKEEIERIRERFTPLILICKTYGTAMRIGTNHGSLSDRILSRYGDTPLGMVESAFEFLRICKENDYDQVVLSMKASNTKVMVEAYRLLCQKMFEENMTYPLHLGVTEAGEGEDGRIKSAVGIGALLEDGIGDTIRVSLTEEPEEEAPVASALADRYKERSNHPPISAIDQLGYNPYAYARRQTNAIQNIGSENVPVVIGDLSAREKITPASLFAFGYVYNVKDDKWSIQDMACDYVYLADKTLDFQIPGTLGIIQNYQKWLQTEDKGEKSPLLSIEQLVNSDMANLEKCFVNVSIADIALFSILQNKPNIVLVINTDNKHGAAEQRKIFSVLFDLGIKAPVIIRRFYNGLTETDLQLHAATDMGSLLIDGLGDGVMISSVHCAADRTINQLCFGILQATRTRISKTEYISCPSCGRTLFDLQETTQKIRAKTDHLKGLKIGVMGCIVNGPGEMADADYGYVGTGKDKISLYKGQEVVKRNVPSASAVDELIELIKDHGDWID